MKRSGPAWPLPVVSGCDPEDDADREETMTPTIRAAALGVLLCLNTPAAAEMYSIKNPAEKIDNPAGKMYNPATRVDNPAGNIYNPATRMNSPETLSPPTQPPPAAPPAAEAAAPARPVKKAAEQPRPIPAVPRKEYNFKTARAYINAAKKAFVRDDYVEFIAIAEDALRRISEGTLKASRKSRQKLTNYKSFGYGLLEKSGEDSPPQ